MSEPDQQATQSDDSRPLPVLASAPEARVIERVEPMPLSTPALVAAGGFLAGLTTFLLARVLRGGGRRLPLPGRRRRRGLEVAGSRSFLVDVHVLKR